MPKGLKLCKSCEKPNGLRSRFCKYCNSQFAFKAKPKSSKVVSRKPVDWHTLEPGTLVKVAGGPVYNKDSGEQVGMGVSGIVKVDRLEKDGFFAFGSAGREFVYMGEKRVSEKTGILLKKHKLKLVKERKK